MQGPFTTARQQKSAACGTCSMQPPAHAHSLLLARNQLVNGEFSGVLDPLLRPLVIGWCDHISERVVATPLCSAAGSEGGRACHSRASESCACSRALACMQPKQRCPAGIAPPTHRCWPWDGANPASCGWHTCPSVRSLWHSVPERRRGSMPPGRLAPTAEHGAAPATERQ